MRKLIRGVLLVLAVALVSIVVSAPAMAKDVIHLKDGRTLEGRIVRQLENGAVYFEIEIGSLKNGTWYSKDDIASIERDSSEPIATEAPAKEEDTAPVIPDGATKVAFISLEEEVGPYFNKDAIEHSIGILNDLPKEQQPDIVVFVVDSGGGALFELQKIAPYIQDEVKPKYRTVAWIRSAISAAAMSAWVIPEIYMMSEGNIGACTGFMMEEGGQAKAMEGDELEQLLVWMEQVSRWGNKDPYIMRAMEVYTLLSATRDDDGHIKWFIDEPPSGKEIVSPKKEILTFSAHDAVKWGVAQGIADSKDELAKEMGCAEWVEVGQKADEYQKEFRGNVKQAEVQIDEHWAKLNIALQYAGSAPTKQERQRNIGEARNHLRAMQSWVRRAPSLAVYKNLTPEFFREMERRLRDLANNASNG